MKTIAIILSNNPFANSSGADALDMSMVLGSFEVPTALFFVGDAVNQFRTLSVGNCGIKDFTRSIGALPFYDVEELYIEHKAMLERGLQPADLIPELTILDSQSLRNKLATFDMVVTF